MAGAVKISQAALLALHTMTFLASQRGKSRSTRDMAGLLGVSEAHLSKVLQRLTRSGLVRSQRGPRGGFMICKDGGEVRLLDVYESIEGPLDSPECLLGEKSCNGDSCCITGDLLGSVNQEVQEYLAGTRLREVSHAYCDNGKEPDGGKETDNQD